MTDSRMEALIGRLLRAGVLLSLALVLAGAFPFLIQHGGEAEDYSRFDGVNPLLMSVSGICRSAFHLRGEGLIQFGLLVLIATPVARVALAGVAFAMENDRQYVVISLIVLTILGFSLVQAL